MATQHANKIYNIEKIDNAKFSDGKKKLHFKAIPKPSYFIGRDDLLDKIHKQLQKDEPVLLVNGLGGIGKTAVADVYVDKFKSEYKHIAKVFVSGGLRQSIVSDLARNLGVNFDGNMSLEQQFELVIEALQQVKQKKKPNLLVVDNANDKQDLIDFKYLLQATNWKVLITSRCFPDEYKMLEVDELSEHDAKDLFLHHYLVEGDLLPLLQKINFHTLLIELTAKAGKRNHLSIAQLLEKLETGLNHEDLQLLITVGSHADNPLREKQTELYRYILALFGLESNNQFKNNLFELFQAGWLSAKDSSYKMHSLVQDVIFVKLKANLVSCADLITTLSTIMEPDDGGFLLNPDKAWGYQEYAYSVTQKFKESNINIGSLNLNLANFYKNIGRLETAFTSIDIARKHFDNCQDKENLAASYSRLGSIHQALGNLDKALELRMQLGKQLYDSNPKNMRLKNSLAISYYKLGTIYQDEIQAKLQYQTAINLWKELYDLTGIKSYKENIEEVKLLVN